MKNILILAAFLIGLGTGCELRPPISQKPSTPDETTPGAKPDAVVKTISQPVYLAGGQGEFSLGAFKGQVVVLDFCADWSPSVEGRIKDLHQLLAEQSAAGLAVVGMVIDGDAKAGLPAPWQGLRPDYPLVATPRDALARFGSIRAVPSTVVVDRKGQIRHRYPGFVATEQLRTDVVALLNEQ